MKNKQKDKNNKNLNISVPKEPVKIPPQIISFDQWWMLINKQLKLQSYMKEILRVDFNARGLKEEETQECFDAACRKFGYEW